MKKGQCKDALEIYKRFLTRMTRVSEFLKVAEVSNSTPVWEYNLKLLTLLSGVHSRFYNMTRRSTTESQCIRVRSDLRSHLIQLHRVVLCTRVFPNDDSVFKYQFHGQ